MSTYNCPKGHISTEADYCSECGAKIQGIVEVKLKIPEITVQQIGNTVINCPDCNAPHDNDSGNFCEICGYNFLTGAHGELAPINLTPINNVTAEEIKKTTENIISNPVYSSLELLITIDPALREPDSPPAPTDRSPITLRLDKENNLIGRTSELKGIHPEIALDFDDAVSRRHALIIKQTNGIFVLRDIDSANGTKLNNVELQPMLDVPIKNGDEITLGHWTRIVVKTME